MNTNMINALKRGCSSIEESPQLFFTPELHFFRQFVQKWATAESDSDDEAPPPCAEEVKIPQAMTLDDNYLTIIGRAEVHLSKNRFKQAVKCCDEALGHNPNSYRAYRCQAKAYLKLDDLQAALTSAQEAQSIDYCDDISRLETHIKTQLLAKNRSDSITPPDISSFLNNPNLMNMASNLMRNPEMVANMQTMFTNLGNQNCSTTSSSIIEDDAPDA